MTPADGQLDPDLACGYCSSPPSRLVWHNDGTAKCPRLANQHFVVFCVAVLFPLTMLALAVLSAR